MKFDPIWADKYIKKELNFYNIQIKEFSVSDCGLAWPELRQVKIPQPTTLNRFLICMHEIFHIARFSAHKSMKVYEYEYDCEMWTLMKAKKLGFDTKEYEHRAKGYVMYCFAKAFNRGLNLDKANKDILNWLGIDIDVWKNHQRAVVRSKKNWDDWSVKLF